MFYLLRSIASLFVGVAMTVYGLVHSVTRFPGGDAFAALAANMPAVTSVLVFVLGIAAVVAGIVLIVIGIKQTRRRWRRFNQVARHVEDRPSCEADDDGEWEPAYR